MKKPKKFIILGIVLLLSVNVFAQEVNFYKDSDQVLLERIEKYLNSISFFDRIFLNIVIEKIDPLASNYIQLNKDVPVWLIISNNIDCSIDYTDSEGATIYLTSGLFLILRNEAELIASIGHELGHLSSLRDRIYQDITKEEYLKSEMAADRMGILVAKEIGYKPEALANLLELILVFYPIGTTYQEFLIDRLLVARKLAKEIYKVEPKKEYKEYLYFTETQFRELKEIVKYLQDKSGK